MTTAPPQMKGDRNGGLFREYRRWGDRRIRDQIIEENLGLARALASRYLDRGASPEDLRQVAVVGLVKAVDRFDPDRGVRFSSFAVPTILGELRRHFRDVEWTVTVPRRLQELRGQVDRTARDLEQRLCRRPRIQEIAAELHVHPDEVLLALDGIRSCYRPDHLDTDQAELQRPDDEFSHAEDHVVVTELLEGLPERQRRIVILRFWGELTQQEIADVVGCSQMHVSRLLRRALERMAHDAEAREFQVSA